MARSELGLGPRVAGGARSTVVPEPPSLELYDHLLQVCVLLLLQETAAGARELRDGLRPLGFEQTASQLEATLGALAHGGLVARAGDRLALYELTGDGESWLRDAKTDLRRTEVVLGGFLARCSERFVTRA